MHNSATLQHLIPHDLLVLENKRISVSKFKYRIAGDMAMVVDTHPDTLDRGKSRKRAWSPQQTTLEQHWGSGSPASDVGPPEKRQRTLAAVLPVVDVDMPVDSGPSGVRDEGTFPPTGGLPVSTPLYHAFPPVGGRSVDGDVHLDATVTCLSKDPTLPRRSAPVGPFCWAVEWGFSHGTGLFLEQKLVPDFVKTGLCDRRMLVSHKRTSNIADIASAWRKAKIAASLSEDEISGELLDDPHAN
jgi:hypothetical protein